VQGGNHAIHFVIDFAALGICHAGQGLVPEHAAFDKLHYIKSAANHRLVFAQTIHFGHRHVGALQAAHDLEFALDRMGGRQQSGDRAGFGAHHIGRARGDEFVGGIGLPALENLSGQRAFETVQMFV